LSFLVFSRGEALRLQIEHGPVAAALCHQLIMSSQFNDSAVFENADAVRVTNGRKTVRYEDRRAVTRCREDAIENLGFTSNIQLGGRFVEKHDSRSHAHRTKSARQCDALPLS